MSDTFTASNGKRISTESEEDMFRVGDMPLTSREVVALREFFQHERDQELGRWRWPESPQYVVYLGRDGQAVVLNEADGWTVYRYRGEDKELRAMRAANGDDVMPATKAAAAYFDAHPEPKPWHDAKPGEVWVLSLEGEPETAQAVDGYGKFMPWTIDVVSDGNDRGKITAGRRIFPEVTP